VAPFAARPQAGSGYIGTLLISAKPAWRRESPCHTVPPKAPRPPRPLPAGRVPALLRPWRGFPLADRLWQPTARRTSVSGLRGRARPGIAAAGPPPARPEASRQRYGPPQSASAVPIAEAASTCRCGRRIGLAAAGTTPLSPHLPFGVQRELFAGRASSPAERGQGRVGRSLGIWAWFVSLAERSPPSLPGASRAGGPGPGPWRVT